MKLHDVIGGGIVSNPNDVELYLQTNSTLPNLETTSRYQTISRFSLYRNDAIGKINGTGLENNVNFTKSTAMSQESIKPIIELLTEDEMPMDSICAFTMEKEVVSKGVIWSLPNNDNRSDFTVLKRIKAECVGCLSDLIILDLQPTGGFELSETENQKILHNLVRGILRRAKAGNDSTKTLILVLSNLSNEANELITAQLKEALIDKNIGQDKCKLEIIRNSNGVRDLNNLILNYDDEIKPVPLDIFPALVQSMATSLINHDNDEELRSILDEFIEFHVAVEIRLRKFCAEDELKYTSKHVGTEGASNFTQREISLSLDDNSLQLQDLSKKLHELSEKVLKMAKEDLDKVEAKQEDALLRGGMPILEFGRDSNLVLEKAMDSYDSFLASKKMNSKNSNMVLENRKKILQKIAYGSATLSIGSLESSVRVLYENQLEALREYYGRRYDNILDEKDEGAEVDIEESAEQCVEGFKTAALHAIPNQCRLGRELYFDEKDDVLPFEYSSVLNGLLKDMMTGLEGREDIEQSWSSAIHDDDTETDDGEIQKKKTMTWYQKLGARLLVMGVNYGQGWLALQGIKRAAAERDRNMPKFPLF